MSLNLNRVVTIGSKGAAERLRQQVVANDPFGESPTAASVNAAAVLQKKRAAEAAQLLAKRNENDRKYGMLAYRLQNSMQTNPACKETPKRLFDSVCPRLRIPLHCTATAPMATWASDVRQYTDDDSEIAPNLLASMLLVASTQEVDSTKSFKHTFAWWFGDAVTDAYRAAVQKQVLDALDIDYIAAMSGVARIPRVVTYIESSRCMWMFFVDGRVDFTTLLVKNGRKTPLCKQIELVPNVEAPEQAAFFADLRGAAAKCNEQTASPTAFFNFMRGKHLRQPTQSIVACTEEADWDAEAAKTPLPRCSLYNRNNSVLCSLVRFCPKSGEEFHNQFTIEQAQFMGGEVPFTEIVCRIDDKTVPLLALPSPTVRRAFIDSAVETLRAVDVSTEYINKALYSYDHPSEFRPDVVVPINGADLSVEDIRKFGAAADANDPNGISESFMNNVENYAAARNLPVIIEQNTEEFNESYEDSYDFTSPEAMRRRKEAEKNPTHVRISVGNTAVYNGRMVNAASSSNVKDGEFKTGSGMGSLFASSALAGAAKRDTDGDDDMDGTHVGSLSSKNIDFQSASGSGIAMRLKFETLNAFRKYRRLNEDELMDIAMAHPRGSQEYRIEMQRFKQRAVKQVVETFFGEGPDANAVSAPIRESRLWLSKMKGKIPREISEMLVIAKHDIDEEGADPHFGPFFNFISHLIRDINTAFMPDALMEEAVLLVLTAPAGFWHYNGLRPNILLAGEASVGKSYLLNIATQLMPDGVVLAVSRETGASGLVDGMHTDLLMTKEEIGQNELGVDEYGKEREVDSTQKDRLTNSIRTVKTMEIIKNPETGKTERVDKICHNCEEMARQAATNSKLPPAKNAALVRWIVRHIKHFTDPDHSIVKLISAGERNATPARVNAIKDHWKMFFIIQLLVEKAIEARAIADVNLDAMCEMGDLLDYVQNQYKFSVEDAKVMIKLKGTGRLFTVAYAVYAAACSELGAAFRADPETGDYRKLRDVACDIIMEVEKYLCATREIVVYTFSLLHTEWMPSVRLSILETIRDMYLSGRPVFDNKELTAGFRDTKGRHVAFARGSGFGGSEHNRTPDRIDWCGPPDSRIAEYDPSALDASCIALCDTNGSTKLDDVARHIVYNMQHRQISHDMVIRELRAMQTVRVDSLIRYHSAGCVDRSNTVPEPLRHPHTKEQVSQKMPLFFCGRLPPSALQRRSAAEAVAAYNAVQKTAPVPRFGVGGFGVPAGAATAQTENDMALGAAGVIRFDNRAAGAAGGFRNDGGQFACMILFEAVFAPTDPTMIIENAVRSLAHRFMTNPSQTFVLSGPTEVHVPYPNGERTLNGGARTHLLQIYTIPRTITVFRDDSVRLLSNPKTTLQYELEAERIGMTSSRHRIAQKTQGVSGMESRNLFIANDPDATALCKHHEMIGIELDSRYYWTDTIKRMCQRHEEAGCRYLTRQDMVMQHIDQWRKNFIALKARNIENPSPAELAEFANLIGVGETAWGLKYAASTMDAGDEPVSTMSSYTFKEADYNFYASIGDRGESFTKLHEELNKLNAPKQPPRRQEFLGFGEDARDSASMPGDDGGGGKDVFGGFESSSSNDSWRGTSMFGSNSSSTTDLVASNGGKRKHTVPPADTGFSALKNIKGLRRVNTLGRSKDDHKPSRLRSEDQLHAQLFDEHKRSSAILETREEREEPLSGQKSPKRMRMVPSVEDEGNGYDSDTIAASMPFNILH